MKCSIIIPCYKEAGNLKSLIPKVHTCMNDAGYAHEIIIVDDNSQDGSESIIEKQAASGIPVRLLCRNSERGLSSAVIYGINQSSGDILVCMDGDMSHNPKYLTKLIEPLIQDMELEFVLGSRFVKGGKIDEDWSFYRHLNSKVATALCKPLINSVKDPMSGFFALPKKTFLNCAKLTPLGYKIGLELLIKCNIKKALEVPIHFEDRQEGESKLNSKEQAYYITHLLHLYDFKFPRVSPFLKLAFSFILGLLTFLIISGLHSFSFQNFPDLLLSYSPFIAVHILLFIPYFCLSKKIIPIKRPVLYFLTMTFVEFSLVYLGVQLLLMNNMNCCKMIIPVIALGVFGRIFGKMVSEILWKPKS
jgi:dolichol-phosphate mannosyltransferase